MASKSGLGSCTFWGLTPALNLLTFLDDNTLIEADDNEKAINILLLGQSDCRHIFKTMEEHLNFSKTKDVKINVYIVENNIELYARQLCFLTLACQPLEKIGLYEKTRQFMELFGNIYLRPRTQATLIRLANQLIKMITDDQFMSYELPFVHISELKFRERDALAEIFKYWTNYCDSRKENLTNKWDKRVRYHLGTRYDSRVRIFDWDYHMRLQELDAKIISSAEYKNWRGTGMAFVDLDSDYSQPNVTLISGASSTTSTQNLCFLGEIVTGPFIAHGIECDDKTMLEKSNDQYKKKSGDVTQHNLEKTLDTISRTKIGHGKEGNDKGQIIDGSGDVKGSGVSSTARRHQEKSLSDIFSIRFLPMESAKHIQLKSQFHNKFQLVYFSSTMAQNLTLQMTQVFTPEAVVIVEGVRYTLELRKEHMSAYEEKVEELAKKVNYSRCSDDNEAFHPDYLTFIPQSLQTVSAEIEREEEGEAKLDTVVGIKPTSSKSVKSSRKSKRNEKHEEEEKVSEKQQEKESGSPPPPPVYCSDSSEESIRIFESSDPSREPSIINLNPCHDKSNDNEE